MAFKRRISGARSGPKRKTLWLDFVMGENTVASGAVLVASLNAAALALRPFTVVRSHVALSIRSDQAAAIEHQNAAFGMAVVSDQSVAIGVTAVPTPVVDSFSSLWMLHTYIIGDESALTDRTRPATNLMIDSKAMRKVELGQDLIFVLEHVNGVGQGFIMSSGGRILIKTN